MNDQTPQNRFRIQSRAVLWGLIVVYTLLIPNAIYVYRFIEARFGLVFAGRIPLVVVSLLGIGYVVYLWRSKLGWKKALYLIPCAVIALAIFRLEGNPNKHIHIPEYILMAWLVYAALKKDYRGGGMLILVFLLASMLGVVDELEQGIHPGRTYGWTDMLVNTSSALMGVFTILGLTDYHEGSWDWVRDLKNRKKQIVLILFGVAGAIISCIELFSVQRNNGDFSKNYPLWVFLMNLIFLLTIFIFYIFEKKFCIIIEERNKRNERSYITSNIWFVSIIAILSIIHSIPIVVLVWGINFK